MTKTESSRINGARSQGPKTEEGKRRSSLNAVTHGLLSNGVVLQHESQETFDLVLALHLAKLALRKLKRTEVQVIVLKHLTANQKRAFILADNKLALNAGWDSEMLRLELEARPKRTSIWS